MFYLHIPDQSLQTIRESPAPIGTALYETVRGQPEHHEALARLENTERGLRGQPGSCDRPMDQASLNATLFPILGRRGEGRMGLTKMEFQQALELLELASIEIGGVSLDFVNSARPRAARNETFSELFYRHVKGDRSFDLGAYARAMGLSDEVGQRWIDNQTRGELLLVDAAAQVALDQLKARDSEYLGVRVAPAQDGGYAITLSALPVFKNVPSPDTAVEHTFHYALAGPGCEEPSVPYELLQDVMLELHRAKRAIRERGLVEGFHTKDAQRRIVASR